METHDTEPHDIEPRDPVVLPAGGMTRRGVLGLGAATAGAVWLASSVPSAASAAVDGLADSRGLADAASAPPFSFTYDGAASSDLLPHWPRTIRSRDRRDGRRTVTVTWRDPRSGLRVSWENTTYRGFPTKSWTVEFENAGKRPLPTLSDVLALDVEISDLRDSVWQIRTANGSSAQATDFEPYVLPLPTETFRLFTTGGGRPTNGYRNPDTSGSNIGGGWPFWNIDFGGEGLIAAIGWPGQWAAEINRSGPSTLRLRGGVSHKGQYAPDEHVLDDGLTDVVLRPRESITSPLVVLQPWAGGDWIDAQNTWRKWFVEHNLPKVGDSTIDPLSPTQANDYFVGQTDTVDDELEWLNAYGSNRATVGTGGVHDHWWVDAGWYDTPDDWPDPNTAWVPVGTWQPDHERFPKGLKPVSKRAHKLGMKSIVWFEPERVMPETWLYDNHPEWLLRPGPGDQQFEGKARLFNFGNDEARAWAIQHFDGLIRSENIDVYREDFNIDPLEFWNFADVPELSVSHQFSDTQGDNGWHYQDKIDGAWHDIGSYRADGYLHQREWHDPDGGYVWPGALHPGPSNDTAMAWTAPRDGTVDIIAKVAKVDPGGDGVVVRITKDDAVIWGPTTLAGSDLDGVDSSVSAVAVLAGDVIRFVINRYDTYASDSTHWDPVIVYPEQRDSIVVERGHAQIRYVLGHLAYWRELRRRNPHLMIDNCASGGRRMDVLSLSESMPLLRSDFVLNSVGNQAHTYGVSFWAPMTGDAARITGASDDTYKARSAMAPSYHLALDVREPTADWATLRKMSFEWNEIKASYKGDFYPLTDYSVDEAAQLAFQFQTGNGKHGFVQAFRRSTNPSDRVHLVLRGLARHSLYELRDYENGTRWWRRGADLMGAGMHVHLATAPLATTVRYRRV